MRYFSELDTLLSERRKCLNFLKMFCLNRIRIRRGGGGLKLFSFFSCFFFFCSSRSCRMSQPILFYLLLLIYPPTHTNMCIHTYLNDSLKQCLKLRRALSFASHQKSRSSFLFCNLNNSSQSV